MRPPSSSFQHWPWVMSIALMAYLAPVGCAATGAAPPTATQPPQPAVTEATIDMPPPTPTTPVICNADEALRRVGQLLAGRTFEAHYLTMNQQLTLSIWLVDPEIDPHATVDNLGENNRRAMLTGLSLFQEIIGQIPCVRQLFVNANPMIVDRLYQGWYRDVIPISAFPEAEGLTGDNLVDAMMGNEHLSGFFRRYPPVKEEQLAPADACTWTEVRAAIGQSLGPERRNAAAYLIIDAPADTASHDEGVLVELQWDVQTIAEMDNVAILEKLNHVAKTLTCLWPPVDRVEVFVVDAYGRFAVFAAVPGALIREGAIPLPPDRVLIHPLSENEW